MTKPCICCDHKPACDCTLTTPKSWGQLFAELRFWWHRKASKLMGSCRKCGETKDVICYDPRSLWFYFTRKTYCPHCCPEHEYAYDRDMREWCCNVCSEPAPMDFWAYDPYEP